MLQSRKEDTGNVLVEELPTAMRPGLHPTPVFESRFESGNLEMVSQLGEFEYNLLLQNDVNAMGKTQWFFFRVSQATPGTSYSFHILNFCKPESLFNSGMSVTVYSLRSHRERGLGWHHAGSNILYYPNGLMREDMDKKEYFSLSFEYVFQYSNDDVYFAYSYPYTYSQLQSYLYSLDINPFSRIFTTRKTLCRSLSGNPCDYLTITNSHSPIAQKRGIFLSARVHPGETVGSYVMKGVLDFLTSDSHVAEMLRNQFVFKIVPMLNPDGVINGNHRCGVLGVDLNRRWRKPHKTIHPTIFHSKRLIKSFAAAFPLDLVCDLHGHSRKSGIFMYGNNLKSDPISTRLFPYILSKLSSVFHFPYCNFTVTKSKEATLRVALFKELQIPCVYTLESSFLGAEMGSERQGVHFTVDSLEEMGRNLCIAILVTFGKEGIWPISRPVPPVRMSKTRKMSIYTGKTVSRVTAREELMSDPRLMSQGEGESSSGSDSDSSVENTEMQSEPSDQTEFRPSTRLVLKLPGPSNRSKRTLIPKAKKCSECGLELSMGHVCPRRMAPSPSSESLKPIALVGLKTYYTLQGKKVHDQTTQTKVSFYALYKANKERAAQLQHSETLQAPSITIQPEVTPEAPRHPPSFHPPARLSIHHLPDRMERLSLSQSFAILPDSQPAQDRPRPIRKSMLS